VSEEVGRDYDTRVWWKMDHTRVLGWVGCYILMSVWIK